MIVRFSGRSAETYRIKAKPIGEGYKLYALCDSKTGFVFSFTPDGRISGNQGGNEFSQSNADGGKLYHMVLFLHERVLAPHESTSFKFVVFMDNFFTYPKIIAELKGKGVAVVGTARPKRNWPPNELKVPSHAQFNDLYYCSDDFGNLTMRWVDNNIVMLVSNAHNPGDFIERPRRKPRLTNTNKTHVESVWGHTSVTNIQIPLVIDDYNNHMNGVDIADQRISSYAPDLRCHRTWMPLMLQCCPILRKNAFVVHRDLFQGRSMDQKVFMLRFCESLQRISRARTVTRNLLTMPHNSQTPRQSAKRSRMSKNHPTLPGIRHEGYVHEHTTHLLLKQRYCIYCRFLKAKACRDGSKPPKMRKVRHGCSYCKEHVCRNHFDAFHAVEESTCE